MPPAGLEGEASFSGFALMLPYLEQSAVYDLVSDAIQNNSGVSSYSNWWINQYGGSILSDEQKSGISSISFMKCPTRRSGASSIDVANSWCSAAGPRGDYAMVTNCGTDAGWWVWAGAQISRNEADGQDADYRTRNLGPFRSASYSGHSSDGTPISSTWKVRDTLAMFTDGTSNTLIFGEKQLYMGGDTSDKATDAGAQAWLDYSPPAEDQEGWGNADGTWLVLSIHRSYSVFRPTHFTGQVGNIDSAEMWALPGLQPRNEFRDMWWLPMGFGGWHTGVTNFALGDGSVSSLSDSVNPRILAKLGVPNDGLSVAFP